MYCRGARTFRRSRCLGRIDAIIVFGPRSGAKTQDFSIADELPPGLLRDLMPVKVTAVETLRPDCGGGLAYAGGHYESGLWRETIEVLGGDVVATYEDRAAAAVRSGKVLYLATLSDDAFLAACFGDLCGEAGIVTLALPDTLRIKRRGDLTFAFNFAGTTVPAPAPQDAQYVIGGAEISAFGVAVWRG